MIAVVYLVWGPLGPGPLRQFLDSYREHEAGADHELVVIYNGVTRGERPALDSELEATNHQLIELAAPVLDLAAYAQVLPALPHETLCFFNSYSEILATDWLAKLNDALEQPSVGIVGATGSWASLRSKRMSSLFLPSPYRGLLRRRHFSDLLALEHALDIERKQNQLSLGDEENAVLSAHSYIRHALRGLSTTPGDLRNFEPFPAHHVRTNAFIIRRETFEQMRMPTITRKADTYALESGRNSLTRQIEHQQLSALVVAKSGAAYKADHWHQSETLWQGNQDGLLVGDNQTRLYQLATFEHRKLLATLAWGRQARPQALPGTQISSA